MDKNQPFILKSKNKPVENASPPSIVKQVSNFLTSTVSHVAQGMPQTSDLEQEKRMAICRECDKYSDNNGNPRCMDCGCYLKIKTSWAGESCPQNKWLPVVQAGGCGCDK